MTPAHIPDPNQPDMPQPKPRRGSLLTLILWLVVISMSIMFVSLYFIPMTIQELDTTLESELASIQQTLEATRPVPPQEATMSSQLVALRSQSLNIGPIADDLAQSHLDWPAIMDALSAYDHTIMEVTGITQSDLSLVISGRAQTESGVTAYADQLRTSDILGSVQVQSISLVVPKNNPDGTRIAEFKIVVQVNRVEVSADEQSG